MEVSTFISDNWLIVTSFISGLIAGNPRTVKRLFGVFAVIFSLYRLFIFLRELKNPAFRRFLFNIFVTSLLLISIIFFAVASTGCSRLPDRSNVTSDSFPDMYEDHFDTDFSPDINSDNNNDTDAVFNETNKITVVAVSSNSSSRSSKAVEIDRYFQNFEKLATKIINKRTGISKKQKKSLEMTKREFRKERAASRNSMLISCNVLASRLRLSNKKIASMSKDYGKTILQIAEDLDISKRKLLKLPLNTCEKYGISFLFRLKQKATKLSSKWLFCSDYASLGIVPKQKRKATIVQLSKLKASALKFREDYLVFAKCRKDNKSAYFDKLKMGLFPSRRLNE